MHQARTMQARQSVLHVDLTADFEHKLSYRPRALLAGIEQEAEDRRVVHAQDFRRVQRRVVLHGKVPPFLATVPGGSRRAGTNL
jgi:hypothetical protein